MRVSKDTVVAIDYTLTDSSGQTLDTSIGGEPLTYLHGAGNIIPGLEHAMDGKGVGDAFRAEIAPEQAYGVHRADLVSPVPKSAFGEVKEIKKGMQFQAKTPQGPRLVTVIDVIGDEITIDANHELAGKTLIFDVKVVDVRAASVEEVSHGHVHGPGGHQHG